MRLANLSLAIGIGAAGCGIEREEEGVDLTGQQGGACVCTDPLVLNVNTRGNFELWDERGELVDEGSGSTAIRGICTDCKTKFDVVTAGAADFTVLHDGELRFSGQAAPKLGFDQVGDLRTAKEGLTSFSTEGEEAEGPFTVRVEVK